MKRKILSVLFLFFAIANNVYSQGNEKALVFATIDYSFQDRWYKSLSSTTPMFNTTKEVVKGQKFIIPVIFADYSVSKTNDVNLSYDIKILDPENKIYLEQQGIKGAVTKVNSLIMLMAEGLLWISFDPEDMLGKYKIEVTVEDHIAKTTFLISTEIELVEKIKFKSFKNDDEFSEWLMTYYQKSEPQRLLSGYKYYIGSKMSQQDATFPPVLGFYVEAVSSNDYLIDEIIKSLAENDLRENVFFLYLLYYINNEKTVEGLKGLTGKEKELYNKLKEYPTEYVSTPIANPSELDYLWGSFFASGKYKYILELINVLGQKDTNAMIYNPAKWSITSNITQHLLVYKYVEYIYQTEKIPKEIKKEIKGMISK